MEAIRFAVLTESDPATGQPRIIVREQRTSFEPARLSKWVQRPRGGIRNRARAYLAEAKGEGPCLVAAELERRREAYGNGRYARALARHGIANLARMLLATALRGTIRPGPR